MNHNFRIGLADRQSPLWRALSEHLEQRLDMLRLSNDQELDPVETASVRGQITEVKRLLALATPGPNEQQT